MKILILGKDAELIADVMDDDDEVMIANPSMQKLVYIGAGQTYFIISFNYKYIIPKSIIDKMPGRIINIHTSYLPYNRGAYPNFFSWLHDTPKGVTIHYIDEGIDTGDIIVQRLAYFNTDDLTLKTTYDFLIDKAVRLFKEYWRFIKKNKTYRIPQNPSLATYHTKKDFDRYKHLLTKEWDTPVCYIDRYIAHAKTGTHGATMI